MASQSPDSPSSRPPLSAGEKRARDAEVRVGWRMAALAMQVAAEVGAGALLGWLFDRWQGTTSGVLIGSIVGILVGLWSLIKGGLSLNRQLDREAPLKGRGKPLVEESKNGRDIDEPSPDDDEGEPADEDIEAFLRHDSDALKLNDPFDFPEDPEDEPRKS